MNIQTTDVEKASLKICNGCLKKWTTMCDVNDVVSNCGQLISP